MTKVNLDSLFKMDNGLETEGVEFKLSDETSFFMRRMGGANRVELKKAMSRYYAPYAKQVEMGTLSEQIERGIMHKVFVDAILVDWKGVEVDGVELEFNKENALTLFKRLPDLFETLQEYASNSIHFREEVGNS